MAQKRSTYIPEGSDPTQEKFVNYIMKGGKKSTARNIYKETLAYISEKTKIDPVKVFEKAVETVKPALEVRPKRIGGAVYQIPIEVKPGRQMMLTFRWILDAARSKKGASMYKKLADELIQASNGEGAAIKKRDDMQKMAMANKAFAHYAKY